jgi:hypothetical protein
MQATTAMQNEERIRERRGGGNTALQFAEVERVRLEHKIIKRTNSK